ncbi:MAG: NADH-quinone oxidoreductase subunit J [Actinomycetota bacterium]
MNQLAFEVGQTATPEAVQFYILAPIAVLAALGILVVKKAVHAALLMAWIMITLAIFYIANGAAFLGVVQVVVYTGAVMMLFLFILMLVGVDSSDSLKENLKGVRPIAITASVGIALLLVSLISRASLGRDAAAIEVMNNYGNVEGIASLLFTKYVWAFEFISALLITAAVGAMVLAHSQKSADAQKSQRVKSLARFRGESLGTAAGLPGSGVFARHNAVDVPALLPDGTPSELSVSKTLKARGDVIDGGKYALDQLPQANEADKDFEGR